MAIKGEVTKDDLIQRYFHQPLLAFEKRAKIRSNLEAEKRQTQ